MAPYISLSHVQYEINTEAPAAKKTSEKLPSIIIINDNCTCLNEIKV